ncbi:hypothetical protein IHC93_19770 [Photobacterium damselae subsp. damselae]|uniref:hypothetical protein n=1 Tax=Photobacterium damselae TaxID=38293 RepID=UPI001F28793D|nr:hypothetical protein [Photobacterium damselae]UKA27163.1 hypothetical protein IHC93_19770 [Photobacterium damselae subsp. damselae]
MSKKVVYLNGQLIAHFLQYLDRKGFEITLCKSGHQPIIASKGEMNHFFKTINNGEFLIPEQLVSHAIEFYKLHEK